MKLLFILISILLCTPSIWAKGSCQPKNPKKEGGYTCYDPSMFSGLSGNKKKLALEFAPIAVYMQERTGYPASVTLAHIPKEKGWSVAGKKGTALFGVMGGKTGVETFTVPGGQTFSVRHNGKEGAWQGYKSRQDSVLGYLNLVLDRDKTIYKKIHDQVPSNFPPPGDRKKIVKAISDGPFCQASCKCDLGNGKKGTYEQCFNSILQGMCADALDKMVLCNYDYPILAGLPTSKGGTRSAGQSDGTQNAEGD